MRQDLRFDVIEAIGGEEQGHGRPPEGRGSAPRHVVPMRKDLPNRDAEGTATRFAGGMDRALLRSKTRGELGDDGGAARAIDSLHDDEDASAHGRTSGGASSPSTMLSMS